MAEVTFNVPGETNVTMQQTDTLLINFTANCNFCIDSGDAEDFSPALPVGANNSGTHWTGRPKAAASGQSYGHHHVDQGAACNSPKRSPTRTISVTSGKE